MKKKINRNKGILFWITGLSGSGKTTIAKKIFPIIKKKYGPTVILDGDKCRKALNLCGFTYKDRLSNSRKYNEITKILTDQKINVIFSLVCLMNKPRIWNRKYIDNYLEIFIDCELKKIIKKNKKKKPIKKIVILLVSILNLNFLKTQIYLLKMILKLALIRYQKYY